MLSLTTSEMSDRIKSLFELIFLYINLDSLLLSKIDRKILFTFKILWKQKNHKIFEAEIPNKKINKDILSVSASF